MLYAPRLIIDRSVEVYVLYAPIGLGYHSQQLELFMGVWKIMCYIGTSG